MTKINEKLKMKNIKKIFEILEEKKSISSMNYYIPKVWNVFGYEDFVVDEKRSNEIIVNPYDFFIFSIKSILNNVDKTSDFDASLPLGLLPDYKLNLNNSVLYCMLVRMFTAWKHDNTGRVYEGTFLKSILMLPELKALGINILYLLPIFENSDRNKKGECGSPYAIKNFHKIDSNLNDGILGEYSEELLNLQFGAFIEVCHALGINVMVDFVFRTVARDNDLIVEHPDWFYWIKKEEEAGFCAPYYEELPEPKSASKEVIPIIYKNPITYEYIKKFSYPPDVVDNEKWRKLKEEHRKTGNNILDLIERDFSITTVPGFSDVLNDTQPPWTDVTYIKIFKDLHKEAKEYVNDVPPYILQDGAKASVFLGDVPNEELWNYIENVIPYFQDKFGIDGARIDMGHALPAELNTRIISRAREKNRNFILWSEEFDTNNSRKAAKEGFNFMTGRLFYDYKNIETNDFYELFVSSIIKAEIPVAAAIETPDTPRMALRFTYREAIQMALIVNYFIPNGIPIINNGMEILEKQPINLGLDNSEEGRYVLDPSDPMYGKLGFFDNYVLHWDNQGNEWVKKLLKEISYLKKKYEIIGNPKYFIYHYSFRYFNDIIFLPYINVEKRYCIFLLSNRTSDRRARVDIAKLLSTCNVYYNKLVSLHRDFRFLDVEEELWYEYDIRPKEVIIGVAYW